MPATVKRRMRGANPAGVALPSGAMSTTVCPTFTSSSSASTLPRITRNLPGCRSSSEPCVMREASPTAFTSSAGRMPRTAAARDALAIGEQAARLDERRHGHHVGLPRRVLLRLAPIRNLAFETRDDGMRCDRQDAAAQFLLEAIEHRHDHDEHGHAQRQADHRHERHERHEAAAMRGTQVAQCRSAIRRRRAWTTRTSAHRPAARARPARPGR